MTTPASGQTSAWAWRPPSRETRDTLFLIALIAWTVAPHLPHLPFWVSLICLGVLGWRARLAWAEAPLPGRWSLVLLVTITAGLTFWTEHTLIGRQAGVTLLVALMAAKTLELKARRDALVLFFLGFFLVLTHFLNSQSMLTALGMTLSVWGWLTALTLAHMPAGYPPLTLAARLAARATLWGTPLMVALFMLFPRIGPLWALPSEGGRTGLSDQLKLGDVASLASDDSIALRVKFEGMAPPLSALYFRGPVLSDYDGQRWQALPAPITPQDASTSEGGLRYQMTVEPLRQGWLPLLDYPAGQPVVEPSLPASADRPDTSGQWRLSAPLSQRVRVTAQASDRAGVQTELSPRRWRLLTTLPVDLHPRTRAWAQALRERPDLQGADARALAQAVLQEIRQQPFTYTLNPGSYQGDAVDEFWLGRRAGFCEHYAASFAVVMRSMGIPARIVTGYQGADAIPQDGHWVVRQQHAHAWVEIWQTPLGWLRVDPTAAVAPERVQRGQALSPSPGLMLGALDAVGPGVRQSLRRWVETIDNRWNQWVLGYGKPQQGQLLSQLGWDKVDTWGLLRLLVILAATAGLAGALWAWIDGRRQPVWPALMRQVRQQLRAADVDTEVTDDLATLAAKLGRRHGQKSAPACQALQRLHQQRYAPNTAQQRGINTTAWRREFRSLLRPLQAVVRRPR